MWTLNLGPWYGHMILVSGYLVLTADNYSMDVQYQRCTYGNGATLLIFKVWGLAYGRTYGQSRDNQIFLDRWVTKFSKVWGSTLRCYLGLCVPVLFQDSERALICMFKCLRCHGSSWLSWDSNCHWVRIWPTAVGLTLKLYNIKKS